MGTNYDSVFIDVSLIWVFCMEMDTPSSRREIWRLHIGTNCQPAALSEVESTRLCSSSANESLCDLGHAP